MRQVIGCWFLSGLLLAGTAAAQEGAPAKAKGDKAAKGKTEKPKTEAAKMEPARMEAAPMETATAALKNAEGKSVGEVTLREAPHGLVIDAHLIDLPPGPHAFHIHEVGKCEPPFKSAGGHFNPTHAHHGIENPEGMHLGDLPNVQVPENGKANVEIFVSGVTLKKGEKDTVFDADGSALVLHKVADDLKSDPAGNAGDRIACGVITASPAPKK